MCYACKGLVMNLYKVLQQQGHHEQGTATQYTHSTEIVSSRNSQQGNSKQVVQTINNGYRKPQQGAINKTYQPKSIKPHKGLKYSLKTTTIKGYKSVTIRYLL